ncbi:MAG: twin-arginine translocation signal domain-containing protein [Gammaproteobacteria bacterium]
MYRRDFLKDAALTGLAVGGALRTGGSLLAQTALSHREGVNAGV